MIAAHENRLVEIAEAMGTVVSIHGVGIDETPFREAAAACIRELSEAERVFSTYREDSDVRRIQRGEWGIAEASPWVPEVNEACAVFEKRTRGRFSAHWAGTFDPTGFVKGWAVERAARQHLLPLLDATDAVAVGIDVGGDLQVFTAPGSSWNWRIGIVDPADRSRLIATVPLRNGAVATSGSSERGLHVFDPRTHEPITALASATVIAAGLTEADVWATAALVAGDDLWWISDAPHTSGLLVAGDGGVRRWTGGVEVCERATSLRA